MSKLQKVGLAVVAFCLTVAVTRRVQQEVDKETFFKCVRQRNAPSASEARVMKWGNERTAHA
jgi:hypothetical protein